jgi:hypothetical protein
MKSIKFIALKTKPKSRTIFQSAVQDGLAMEARLTSPYMSQLNENTGLMSFRWAWAITCCRTNGEVTSFKAYSNG